jgi:hypothetical protein
MSREIEKRVEHILDEERSHAPDRVDARLAATFAEALQDSTGVGASHDDSATMAAFLDGRLSGAELEDFRAALLRDPSLRADLESAAALLESGSGAPPAMPEDLLARAEAEFAPAGPRPGPSARTGLIATLWPGQGRAWAFAVAALAIAVIGPAALIIGGHGPGPDLTHEEPIANPTPPDLDTDTPQRPRCENTADQKPTAEQPGGPADQTTTKAPAVEPSKDTDPCPPPAPADNGGPPN